MKEIPGYIADYNRVALEAPGPEELFGRFPGLCPYLVKASADFVNRHVIPFVEHDGSPQYYCLVNQVTRSMASAFGGCVALGVELGHSENATEFIQGLMKKDPPGEH